MFLLHSNHCFFVGSYAFYNKAYAFSLVPMLLIFKLMLSRCFLCFLHSNKCLFVGFLFKSVKLMFFVGSYAFLCKTCVFSFVPMLFTMKPMLFRWFLCLSVNAFSLVPMFLAVKPVLSRCSLCFSH